MIGSDLEGANLESRMASWAPRATQFMYQQMPEQSGGGCSAIWRVRYPEFGHIPHRLAVTEHDAAPAVTLIYLPVQGPCR